MRLTLSGASPVAEGPAAIEFRHESALESYDVAAPLGRYHSSARSKRSCTARPSHHSPLCGWLIRGGMVRGFAEHGPEAREAVAALGIGIGIGRERCRVLGIGRCPGTLMRLEEIGHAPR